MAECRPMDQDIAEVLLDAETIRARIAELGAQLLSSAFLRIARQCVHEA